MKFTSAKSFHIIILLVATTVVMVALAVIQNEFAVRSKQVHEENFKSVVKGTMNGLSIEIPVKDMFLPMEYVGESVWDPSSMRKKHSSEEEILDFAVQLNWPDLGSRARKSMVGFSTDDDAYIVIAVVLRSRGKPGEYFDLDPPNRPSAQSRMVESTLSFQRALLPKNVSIIVQKEQRYDLFVAETVGPGSERAAYWNKTVFWDGPIGSHVETYIECATGQYPNPKVVASCELHFTKPEINSSVTVQFGFNRIGEWKSIRKKSLEYVESLESRNKTTRADITE